MTPEMKAVLKNLQILLNYMVQEAIVGLIP